MTEPAAETIAAPRAEISGLSGSTALIVGVGGLGAPASWILAEAGVGRLILVDDDVVDESNLHRQVLFQDSDVGQPKLAAAARQLRRLAPEVRVECVETRVLPDTARELVARADVVLEGADNYATKFLTADAARLEARAVVHGAAVAWRGTAWAVAARGQPCYRCLFEDLPEGPAQNCNSVGVMGPVVGFVACLMADLALGVLDGRPQYGLVYDFDGKTDRLRRVPVDGRTDCALCGDTPDILEIEERRYTRQICATPGLSTAGEPLTAPRPQSS